jgi:hypothetical protein
MGALMKCDAEIRLSASQYKSPHPSMLVAQANSANVIEIKPDGLRASNPTFFEDFTREHSFPGVHIASIEISGSF